MYNNLLLRDTLFVSMMESWLQVGLKDAMLEEKMTQQCKNVSRLLH